MELNIVLRALVRQTATGAALIWLGKQHLAQQDKIVETHRGMDELFDEERPVQKFETAEDARAFLRRAGVQC